LQLLAPLVCFLPVSHLKRCWFSFSTFARFRSMQNGGDPGGRPFANASLDSV
jgi:hypothetical protein